MIKTVIKRDGRKEEFSPNKINGWGQWASETLGGRVDWPSVVLETVSTLPEECTTITLQERLIKVCLDRDSWSYNRMAGRLYANYMVKKIYGDMIPTIKEVHETLQKAGLMGVLDYSDEEYEELEKIINHKMDLKYAHFQLHQIITKYSLQNRLTGKLYETSQFVFMRVAMFLAEDQPRNRRMCDVAKFYEHFSNNRINAPTPTLVNAATSLKGFSSCCVIKVDDNAYSLSIGDHIADVMTFQSAGIGSNIDSRSIGDSVRNGVIKHQGKLPYYRALQSAISKNLQNGRGGAATVHFTIFDPEIETLIRLKNPMSVEEKKIRGLDYSVGSNKFFARKAAKNEKYFTFNTFTAPDLTEAFYSGDEEEFARLYDKYENDPNFKKNYLNARDVLISTLNESYETGRVYLFFPDEMNKHTPFKDKIYSSNLC